MPRSSKLPVLNYSQAKKISIFVPQGRLVAPIQVKFGTTKGYVVPLGQTKFHANRFTGMGTRPKIKKKSNFW